MSDLEQGTGADMAQQQHNKPSDNGDALVALAYLSPQLCHSQSTKSEYEAEEGDRSLAKLRAFAILIMQERTDLHVFLALDCRPLARLLDVPLQDCEVAVAHQHLLLRGLDLKLP